MSGGKAIEFVDLSHGSSDEENAGGTKLTDPERRRKKLLRENPWLPPTWEIPADWNVRKHVNIPLYDQGHGIPPKYADELWSVVKDINKAMDPIPGYNSPKYFTVERMERVQNAELATIYKAAKDAIAAKYELESMRAEVPKIDGTAYHGTSWENAEFIAKSGVKSTRNTISAFGRGFYTGMECLAVASLYPFKISSVQWTPAIVIGKAIYGRNSRTNRDQDTPNGHDDTGGCGNNSIHVTFKESHYDPRYIAVVREATKEEFEKQVELFRQAANDGCPGANTGSSVGNSAQAAPALLPALGASAPLGGAAAISAQGALVQALAIPAAGAPAPPPAKVLAQPIPAPPPTKVPAQPIPVKVQAQPIPAPPLALVPAQPIPVKVPAQPIPAPPLAMVPAQPIPAPPPAKVPTGAPAPQLAAASALPKRKCSGGGGVPSKKQDTKPPSSSGGAQALVVPAPAIPAPSASSKGKGPAPPPPNKGKNRFQPPEHKASSAAPKKAASSSSGKGQAQYKPDPRPSDDSSTPSDDDVDYKPRK